MQRSGCGCLQSADASNITAVGLQQGTDRPTDAYCFGERRSERAERSAGRATCDWVSLRHPRCIKATVYAYLTHRILELRVLYSVGKAGRATSASSAAARQFRPRTSLRPLSQLSFALGAFSFFLPHAPARCMLARDIVEPNSLPLLRSLAPVLRLPSSIKRLEITRN